jgi:hypothetical protein
MSIIYASFHFFDNIFSRSSPPDGFCDLGVVGWVGVDNAWEQEKLEATRSRNA